MKKKTGIFRKVEETISICDWCRKELSANCIMFDYRWNDGYDHYGEIIEVCSMDCLIHEFNSHGDISVVFPGGEDVKLIMPSEEMMKLLIKES